MASSRRKSPVWQYIDLPVLETQQEKIQRTHLHSRHPQEYKLCTGDDDGKRKQTTIERFTGRCSDKQASEITKHICEFVARDLRPLRVVEGTGFKKLINFLKPRYTIPSRTHITSMCNKKYDTLKQELKQDLEKQSQVAWTTDIWTSCTTQAYIIVTAHFSSKNRKLVTKVLQQLKCLKDILKFI